jgi:hypothetical protein
MKCNLNACRSRNASTRLHGCIAQASSELHSASSCAMSAHLFDRTVACEVSRKKSLSFPGCICICSASTCAMPTARRSRRQLRRLGVALRRRRARESKLTRRGRQSYRGIERFQRLRRHRRKMPGLRHLADEDLNASPNCSRRDIARRVALRLVARITTRSHRSLRM